MPASYGSHRHRTVIAATALAAFGCGGDGAAAGNTAEGSGGGSAIGGAGVSGARAGTGGHAGGGAGSGGLPGSAGGNAARAGGEAIGGRAGEAQTSGGRLGDAGRADTSAAQSGSGAGAAGPTGGAAPRGGAGGVAGNAAAGGAGDGGGRGGSGAAGTAGATSGDCNTPPAPSTLVGWATQGSGTTGGGDATPVVVTTADQLSQNLSGSTARVIHVKGSLSGSFSIGSNKTLIGVCGAEIHGHLGIGNQSNVIVRNLKMVGNNCSDSPNECKSGADAITVNSGAHHLWFDHLDVSDGSDGNLDITQGSDFVTVSFTKFSYSSKRSDPEAGESGHRFSNLVGASDTDAADPGHLNITYHHCWWADNVDQRMPRTRRGQIHVFNNLFTASGNSYCTNAGQDAKLLVQNNVYSGVNDPLQIANNGSLASEGNVFTNTSGATTGSGAGFTPPYAFMLDPTSGLETALRAQVGPR